MKTKQDAVERIAHAKIGCFRDVNLDYLVTLKRHVQGWLDEIDDEIAENLVLQNLSRAEEMIKKMKK